MKNVYKTKTNIQTQKWFCIESTLGSDSEEELREAAAEIGEEFCPDNAVANKSVLDRPAYSEFEHSNTLSDGK